jgi:hypothetical protein
MKNVKGDPAFYYCHENDKWTGMLISHVDDFDIAGTKEFVERIGKALMKE